MINERNHFIYKNMPLIRGVSENLYKESSVHFYAYVKIYPDGSICSFPNDFPDWVSHFTKKYQPNLEITNSRLKDGINYWKKNTSPIIIEAQEDARNNFDIDARIEFVYHDKQKNIYHLYSFCSTRKLAEKAYSFYGLYRTKLMRFINYFHKELEDLIILGHQKENRLYIPNYSNTGIPSHTRRHFVTEMKSVGASLQLGDRETEALILYAAGYTSRQIGEMFCRSPKTIDKHIEHIKKKTGCKDRKDLHAYVRDIGLAGMERFFFSYFSH